MADPARPGSALESRVATLEAKLGSLERDLDVVVGAVRAATEQVESERPADEGRALVDHRICCRKCGAQLAIYDPERDQLRIRHKDHYAWVRGDYSTVCRGCGELNELSYTPPAQDVPPNGTAERRRRRLAAGGSG